jgi:hypothetical protein
MTKTKMPRDRQKRQCPVAAPFFLFYRVFGCISDLSEGVSKILKSIFARNASRKVSVVANKQIQNRFFLDFFYLVFGRFSARAVRNYHKKNIGKKIFDPVTLGTLTYYVPTHGGPRFVFGGRGRGNLEP